MGSKEFRTFNWVIFALINLLLISESQGSSSPSLIVTTLNFESSPAISPKLPFVSLSVAPKASKDVNKIIFPSLSISPTSVSKPANKESNTTINAPSKGIDKLISPAIAPTPPEAKRTSNSSSASSPSISPVSNSNKTPPNAHAHSISSPSINPEPHKEKSNSTSDNMIPPSSSSPESHNSSNANTLAPFPSIPKPLASSPHISPISNEANSPPNTTQSPLPTITSPAKSPVLHEDANSSIITQAPSTSNPISFTLSPTLSPTISTNSSIPLVSSPTISPTPHDIEKPTNSTHVPFASNISPIISPIPHLVNTHSPKVSPPYLHISPSTSLPSNDTILPLPSHIHPSPLTPVASPKPHDAKQSSNITHPPLLSSPPNPLETLPAISPIPHLVKVPSNATHVSPLFSPMPHEVNNTTNITHEMAPIVSKAKHHAFSPLHHSPQSSQRQGAAIPPSMPRIHAIPPSSNRREHSPSPHMHVPSITPAEAPSNVLVPPKYNHTDHPLSPKSQDYSIPPTQTPSPSPHREVAFAPSPSKVIPSWHNKSHVLPPPPQTIWALPPPPPNRDCKFLSCQENVTYPPPGSLCVCVMPIKVELRVGISLYTFFPLVTELAQEIASGVFVKQSQVRVMGANADAEDPGKTILLIDLVPLGISFDINTALLVYARFWHKQVPMKDSFFGGYDVLYVDYLGLPPSPPMMPGDVNVDGGSLTNGNARAIKPIGVDVKKNKEKISGTLIAIIISSSVIALVISIGTAWILLLRCRNSYVQPPVSSHQSLLPLSKHSGSGPTMLGSGRSSASLTSSIAAGSAKTFSLAEMERATNNFHELRIIGEGGFGRVYQGTLEDGTLIAVKVLKRNDHQGGREFVAEIEMLSRLHHRNLVKLIGICVEEIRCLVYELIPNGSVESHLHGPDRITPLNWNARIKIALGAARGLAYLHEDSSPRVIHRDFKSSNILLEHDYTPKVSDFGLARVALGEGNDHISTCVMGTFGYVAPEYAMTGHLLVKSDVYSYGVVLLELLTGRKPVDMSQPPGQETLVNFSRPLLTSTEGLKLLIDPSISSNVSLDTIAKVAAIASMCVQPEVSNRPYMGEVVQALKLVCDEGDEYMQCFSRDELCNSEIDVRISRELLLRGRERCFSLGPMRSENEWEKVIGFSSGSMVKNGDQWH